MWKLICLLSFFVLLTAKLSAQSALNQELCFSEEPIEHYNGVFLPMTWNLTIPKNSCEGILEILGFQTWVRMKVRIYENELERTVKFDSIIEGELFDSLHTGEILFSLIETEKGLLTVWNVLTPRLQMDFELEGVCFSPCKLD